MMMGTDPRKNKGSTDVLWKVPPVARQTTGAVLVTGSSGCLGQHVVKLLVFASTTDTVVSSNHIIYGTENTTFVPKNFLMGPYAKSKHHAEQLVLQANNLPLADGSAKLLTCVLRPTTFYGEQDKHFITRIMTIAKLYGNSKIQKVRSTDERLQTTYVGNIAYAHVIAKNALQKNADCAGEIYYITDDTPLEDLYTSIKPYVEAQGSIRVSDSIIPYLLVILIMNISAFVLRLIRPIYQVGEYFPTPATVRYACTTVFFNRQKAVLRLKYCPYYTHEMSHKNSLGYYKHVKV